MKQYRYIILLFIIAGIPKIDLWAQLRSLEVEKENDSLRISAQQLHFLTDKALDKLHNGLTVHLTIDITVVTDHPRKLLYHAQEQFAFSFDLWEEKYSVFHSPPGGRSISQLSASSAEAWCLENMSVPLDVIPEQDPFMIELECAVKENGEEIRQDGAPGLTIKNLIEYFSRRDSDKPLHWKASSGLIHLKALRQLIEDP